MDCCLVVDRRATLASGESEASVAAAEAEERVNQKYRRREYDWSNPPAAVFEVRRRWRRRIGLEQQIGADVDADVVDVGCHRERLRASVVPSVGAG